MAANRVVIASVSPWKAGISRPQFVPVSEDERGRGGEYWIKPVPKGEVYLLAIGDAYQYYQTPLTHVEAKDTITAMQIAEDFIAHNTMNAPFMRPGCHPGVWICKSPDGVPTDEEIAEGHRVTSAYCTEFLNQGNEYFNVPEMVKLISDDKHRLAARWLGREPAWLKPPSDLDFIDCPYCLKKAPAAAAVCPTCRNIVNAARHAQLERDRREVLKAAPKDAVPA